MPVAWTRTLCSAGIFGASLRAVGCATTLASAGLWLARQGVMTPALSKGLHQVSVKLAIPCLRRSAYSRALCCA